MSDRNEKTSNTPDDQAKLAKLREHLRRHGDKFEEVADSDDLTVDTHVMTLFKDDPSCPLVFRASDDGRKIACFSGDGIAVAFRYQDMVTVFEGLIQATNAAGQTQSILSLTGDVIEVLGKEEGEALLKKLADHQTAKRKAREQQISDLENGLEQLANKVGDITKKIGDERATEPDLRRASTPEEALEICNKINDEG